MDVRKHITKLILSVSLSALALVLLGGATYAWFILSTEPEVRGTKVTVGAKNTIQLAPNALDPDSGASVPGEWADYVQLDGSGLGTLSPVSTVDGVHWMLAQYQPLAQGGRLTGFTPETDLTKVRVSCLDFWVKAPEPCRLRVSTEFLSDPANPGLKYLAGSFVVPVPEVAEEGAAFVLNPADSAAAACVRVGFLVEGDQNSTRFTIYEPNGDYHPADLTDHAYYITAPLDEQSQPTDISDRLSVQLQSAWRDNRNIGFQTQLTRVSVTDAAGARDFLTDYCLRYVPEWLIAGHFPLSTADLYDAAENGVVPKNALDALTMAGATGDVYICELPANTPRRVRMFIWLEGTDPDCTFSLTDTEMIIRLELAGETVN